MRSASPGLMHRQPQREDADEEVAHGLREPVHRLADAGHGPKEHQQDHADNAGDAGVDDFRGPEDDDKGHHRQGALPLQRQPLGRRHQQYCQEYHRGDQQLGRRRVEQRTGEGGRSRRRAGLHSYFRKRGLSVTRLAEVTPRTLSRREKNPIELLSVNYVNSQVHGDGGVSFPPADVRVADVNLVLGQPVGNVHQQSYPVKGFDANADTTQLLLRPPGHRHQAFLFVLVEHILALHLMDAEAMGASHKSDDGVALDRGYSSGQCGSTGCRRRAP